MFLPADTDFFRRDPALPGLSTVLDAEAFTDRLRRALARDDLGVPRITYVKYVPRTKCLVGYELKVDVGAVQLHANAYPADAVRRLEKARTRVAVSGPLGPGRIALDDCVTVVSVFPNDKRLKGLSALVDAESRREFLRALVPDQSELWEAPMDCLAYKPERRYVSRIGQGEGAMLLRLYDAEGYVTARTHAEGLSSPARRRPEGPSQAPRIARALGHSDVHGALAFEWLPGRVLSEAIATSEPDSQVLLQVGGILAELHAQEPEGLAELTRQAEVDLLHAEARAFEFACPHLRTRIEAIVHKLGAALLREAPQQRPIHGDFNASQVLLMGDTVAVLDLDAAARGDPAIDLGNFIAHLERDALRGKMIPDRVEVLRSRLVAGYCSGRETISPARIDLHTAVSLILRFKPFRYWQPHWRGDLSIPSWEPHWPGQAEMLLSRVETLLGRVR
jgi:aminoglycoside phosphotransferase (APT) family kinase protein